MSLDHIRASGYLCTATTKKGDPCALLGEEARGGLCHVHDPHGLAQQNIEERREARANKRAAKKGKK